jgi:serine/threonine protein kinase
MSAALDSDKLKNGTVVGRYRIEGLLGEGGMAVVHLGYDPHLARKVAIKVLRRRFDAQSTQHSRMLVEAQAMARVVHPNVAVIHDVGTHEDRLFVAIELIDGGTLSDWQERGPHSWQEVVERYLKAGAGLEAAHQAGLVHRDFKPDNVLVGKDGRICVTDFGLARMAVGPDDVTDVHDVGTDPKRPVSFRSRNRKMTHTGTVLGTQGYIAPEIYAGKDGDARSDQFSFCVALFEAVYHRKLLSNLDEDGIPMSPRMEPTVPTGSVIPEAVGRAIVKGLRNEPEDRHPSMSMLLEELARSLGPVTSLTPVPVPLKARPRSSYWLAGAGAMAAVAAIVGFRAVSVARSVAQQPPPLVVANQVSPGAEPVAPTPLDRLPAATPAPSGTELPVPPPLENKPADEPNPSEPERSPTTVAMVSPGTAGGQEASLSPRPRARRELPRGSLRIASNIPCRVFLNGRPVGNTPTLERGVPAGKHLVRLVPQGLPPRLAKEITIQVPPGEQAERTVSFQSGRLSVQAIPYADVTIDGKPYGQTPLPPFTLLEGPHEVVLENKALNVRKRMTATLKPGQDELLRVYMK